MILTSWIILDLISEIGEDSLKIITETFEASLICVVTFPPLFFILLLLLEKPACVDISVKGFRVAVLAPLILIFTYATISNCRRRMNANSKAV